MSDPAPTIEAAIALAVEVALRRLLPPLLAEQLAASPSADELLDARALAALLGCSRTSAHELLRGALAACVVTLPASGRGERLQRRVSRRDVADWLESRKGGADE